MTKVAAVLCFVSLIAFSGQAQEFRKFKVGIGTGFAKPEGKGAAGGVLFYLEPAYRATDEVQIGFRFESAIVARGSATDNNVDLKVAGVGSYTVNGQYYFSNAKFRPFAGAGVGLFSYASSTIKGDPNNPTTGNEVASASKFGFYPRVGFDAGHFTMSIDYNIVPEENNIKNNYLGIRFGGFFGGGRINK